MILKIICNIIMTMGAVFVFSEVVLATGNDKSGVTPQVINLPSGPGSIQGLGESFEPQLNTGTASYDIPLLTPPGTGGHGLALILSYNSGWGNSEFGLGWRLNLPYIQRQTDKGLPTYTDDDPFIYSTGEELVPLPDGTYRFKVEGSFTRFRRTGPSWEAIERNGKRWVFGETANGHQANKRGTFRWLPQRFIDTNDNEIRFFYQHEHGQIYVSEIRYNFPRGESFGAEQQDQYVSIQLEYEKDRSDSISDYRSRALIYTGWRAKAIEIRALDQRVRRYEFNYDNSTGVSLLTEVYFLGRDLVRYEDNPTTGLPPLRLEYSRFNPSQVRNVSMLDSPPLTLQDTNTELVDINGDALPDIVYTHIREGYRFYLNKGWGRWDNEPIYANESPPYVLASEGVQLADMDGDALVDLVVKSGTSANASFYYYPNQGGTAWDLSSKRNLKLTPPLSYEEENLRFLDLNNDRRIDILQTTESRYYVYYNHIDGWSRGVDRTVDPLHLGIALVFGNSYVQVADMNGDRLQDIVYVADEQITYFPSAGMGDFDEPVRMKHSPTLRARNGERLLADVNGDGLSDLLLVDRFWVFVWLNQAATGYGEEHAFDNVPEYVASESELRLADMNGDGATDLLYSTYPASGDDLFRFLDFAGDTPPFLLQRIDNGLGRVIDLTYRTATDYYVADWAAGDQWTLRSPLPVTVVSRSTVTDKHSGQVYITDYTYRNAYYDGAEKTFRGFALAESIDRGDMGAPDQILRTVFDTGVDDESRKGFVLQQDVVGVGGSCGSIMLTAAEFASSQVSEISTAPANCYSRTINQVDTRVLAESVDGRAATFSYIVQTDVLEFEATSTPRRRQQIYGYDNYGNVTEAFDYGEVALDGSDLELGNDERLTYTDYAINLVPWILNRAAYVYQTDFIGNIVSQQNRFYDGPGFIGLPLYQVTRGNLTRIEDNAGSALDVHWVQSERYRYDKYGNVRGHMDPNGVLDTNHEPAPGGHWTEITFDATFHAYPVVEAIQLEHGRALTVTADYDLGFGVITRVVDFNSNESLLSYDSLARLTAIVRSGDSLALPTQMFTYTLGDGVSSVETASREQFGTPHVFRSITYFDGLGRTLQTRSEGENGQVVVSGATTFNLRGQSSEVYLPYYATESTLAYTPLESNQPKVRTLYDPMLRTIETINPDGTVARVHYRPLAQDIYDEEDTNPDSIHYNTPRTLRYDGLGRHVETLERNGAEIYTTTYGYDLLDNLIVLIDNNGNVKRQHFDGLNRKLWLDDPDRGMMTYTYDAASNVLETVDAKGQHIRYIYDGANRLLLENFVLNVGDTLPDIVYHYDNDVASEYANARNTLGQLAWIEDESGREYYSYDARGNMTGRIKRINLPDSDATLDFVTRMQYDALDRLAELTYADGTVLTHHYNSQSLLEGIPGFVENIDYMASGQHAGMLYANRVRTTYEYDNRLRLKQLSSIYDGTTLQDWHYHFDRVSNILRIDDARPDRTISDDDTRTFEYDDLYRLTSVGYSTGAQDTINYAYDSIGNLIRQTASIPAVNLGDLQYGQQAGPHALTKVGSSLWAYDANGNLITKPDFTFEWDSRDRLIAVHHNNKLHQYHTFDYGNRRITKQVGTHDGEDIVLYPDQTVEVRGDELVKYIFAGDERVAEVHTPFRLDALINGFTNSEWQPENNLKLVENSQHIHVLPGSTVFFLGDHLGSAVIAVNFDGEVLERISYYPYGGERIRTGGPKFNYRFNDHELDAMTGLYNYGIRFYDPEVGRFLSVDPLVWRQPEGSRSGPQLLNTYAYVLNNPIKYVDLDGLKPQTPRRSGVNSNLIRQQNARIRNVVNQSLARELARFQRNAMRQQNETMHQQQIKRSNWEVDFYRIYTTRTSALNTTGAPENVGQAIGAIPESILAFIQPNGQAEIEQAFNRLDAVKDSLVRIAENLPPECVPIYVGLIPLTEFFNIGVIGTDPSLVRKVSEEAGYHFMRLDEAYPKLQEFFEYWQAPPQLIDQSSK